MPRIRTAHKFSERCRTDDVLTDELVDFKSLLLSSDVLKGLSSSGFERPSPIQLKAIPLGRCGLDLIAQAKSGTGKTCVFSVIALESVLLDSNTTQVLIMAPTREIAVQIKDVITAIGSKMDNLVCHVFIGGLPVEDNKKLLKKPCHIAVGTPGRIKHLIENHFLKTESVRLFILDESDKLLEGSFQEQINWIFSSLPSNKQMMAFSATYPEYLAKHLTRYMREPTFVRLNATDPTLEGIKQFYKLVAFHPLPHKTFQEKVSKLLKLLSTLPFNQCLVFSNYQIRAQSLCDTLRLKGWPSVFIAGNQTQSQRLKAIEKLKEFKCRVLISTDLISRGIDAEHVNLVVNMDVPRDAETYLHRIGRAGRFGTQGVAVTFVAQGEEEKLFKTMEENIGITIDELPDPIPQLLYTSETSSKPCREPLLPGTAAVEVDILKDANTKASEDKANQNMPELKTVHSSPRSSDVLLLDGLGKMVDHEKQRSGDGSQMKEENLENDAGFVHNQDERLKSQIKGNINGDLPNNTEAEEGVTAIQNKDLLACMSLQCDQITKEVQFDGAEGINRATQSNCKDVTLSPHRNQTDETAEICEVASKLRFQSDIAEKQHCTLVSSAKHLSSLNGEIRDEVLNKLQDLNFDAHTELRSLNPGYSTYFLTDARNERDGSQEKHTVDCELTALSTDERDLSETLIKEESLSSQNGSSESTYLITEELNGGEYEAVHSTSEDEYNERDNLPSVEEFERDFEKYMGNFSSMDHFDERSSNASELEDEVHESDTEANLDAIEITRESLNEISSDTGQSLISGDTCNDSVHEEDSAFGTHVGSNSSSKRETAGSATSPQRLYGVPGKCNQTSYHELQDNTSANYRHYCNQLNLYQDDRCYADYYHDESVSAVNSYLRYGYCDECCVHNGRYSQHRRGDYPHYGTRAADWSANGQRQSFPASSQQHFDQSCGDIRCYQDSLWNISWYNAYHRQNSCIMQFVAFSRSGIRF